MNPRFRPSCAFLPVFLAVALAACGPDHGGNIDAGTVDGGAGDDGGTTGSSLRLAFIGPATMTVEAGSTTELKVLLVQEEVGPVAGRDVTFTIPDGQNPGGSTIDGAGTAVLATTDETGMARATLTAGADEATFQIVASSDGANQAATGVRVIQLQQILKIKRTSGVVVEASGNDARVETSPSTKVQLRVQITDQFGAPRPGVQVTFGFDGAAGTATFDGGGTAPVTGPSGEATITLDTGSTAPAQFIATARAERSQTAMWHFVVSQDNGGGTGRTCELDSDCALGQVCRAGLCDDAGGACTLPSDCPIGYGCVGGECQYVGVVGCASDDACGEGFHCDLDLNQCVADEPECYDTYDCPDGFECNGNICEPRGDVFPDVSGGWYTGHVFKVGDALGNIGDIVGDGLRYLDQAFMGDLDLPGWLDWIKPTIADFVDEYIPEWVQQLVHILDSLMTVMSELRARGYMEVTQAVDDSYNYGPTFTATEMWDQFVFYYLPLCDPIPAPSDTPPDCARFDMFTDYLSDEFTIGLKVHPFSGKVGPYDATGPNRVLIDKRKVELNFAKLLGWVADELVGMFTGYDTVEEAIVESIDCYSLASSVADLVSDWWTIDPSGLERMCTSLVQGLAGEVKRRLLAITFDVGVLEFTGDATMTLDGNNPPYCEAMGYADFESRNPADGQWSGKFTKVIKNVPGSWTASRDWVP